MRNVRAVREALAASKNFANLWNGFNASPPAESARLPKTEAAAPDRVAVWPVQLLILNPASDRLNVHSCRMTVRMPGVKWAQSDEYFVSDTPMLDGKTAGQPIHVEAKEAKRVQLMFVFAALEQMAVVVPKEETEKPFYIFENKSLADITCRDQARRELRTTSTMWGSLLPETDSEGKRVVYRTPKPVLKSAPEKPSPK
jgi:hypothetical protein